MELIRLLSLLLLNRNLVNIMVGYEYMLNRGSYIYSIIKDHINIKYSYFRDLWTNNEVSIVGFYFPPYSNVSDSTKLPFLIIVMPVGKNNDRKCETFYDLSKDNFYYDNGFKFISVVPQGHNALQLIIPKPFKNNDDPLKIEYDNRIDNINQFELNYNDIDKDNFYKLVIQKLYQSYKGTQVTLWFAGAQIGCLHAKITSYMQYGIEILIRRLKFNRISNYDDIQKIYDNYDDSDENLENIAYLNNIIHDIIYLGLVKKIIRENIRQMNARSETIFENLYYEVRELIIEVINDNIADMLHHNRVYDRNRVNIGSAMFESIVGYNIVMQEGGSKNFEEKYKDTKNMYIEKKKLINNQNIKVITKKVRMFDSLHKELEYYYKDVLQNELLTLLYILLRK